MAEELRISESGVYALISAGCLPHARVGGRIIVGRSELERWLAERALPAEQALERLRDRTGQRARGRVGE